MERDPVEYAAIRASFKEQSRLQHKDRFNALKQDMPEGEALAATVASSLTACLFINEDLCNEFPDENLQFIHGIIDVLEININLLSPDYLKDARKRAGRV